jgi:hypothetical protein
VLLDDNFSPYKYPALTGDETGELISIPPYAAKLTDAHAIIKIMHNNIVHIS